MTTPAAVALYRREKARSARRNRHRADEAEAVLDRVRQQLKAKAARRGRPRTAQPPAPSSTRTDRRAYDRAYYAANRERKIEQAKASFRRRQALGTATVSVAATVRQA